MEEEAHDGHGTPLTAGLLAEYNATRNPAETWRLCHAPFRNMFLSLNGDVNPCCANRTFAIGRYPDTPLHDIWFGQKANRFREYILRNDLSHGCRLCRDNIEWKHFNIVAARTFDQEARGGVSGVGQRWLERLRAAGIKKRDAAQFGYPTNIDFNLSHTCNLECIMCDGWSSSRIWRNRDKKQPMESRYQERFLEEIREFIPHLTRAFFIGGEPFLIEVFYPLWEAMVETRPDAQLIVQTNGTVLNDRIRALIERGSFCFNISIDSIRKETFENIRVGANFERTMANLEYFTDYARRKGTFVNLTVCPIQQNWREIPEIVDFAMKRGISLYFNTVFIPETCSLFGLGKDEIDEIIEYYSSFDYPARTNEEKIGTASFRTLIGQLEHLYKNDEERRKHRRQETAPPE